MQLYYFYIQTGQLHTLHAEISLKLGWQPVSCISCCVCHVYGTWSGFSLGLKTESDRGSDLVPSLVH
jgi:hypothetical protein